MIYINRRIKRYCLLGASAILTAMTLVFTNIGLLEWLTLIPLMAFIMDGEKTCDLRKRGIYGYGFFFFMCYYVVVYHWFFNLYPLDFVGDITPAAAALVCFLGCFGLSALQAVGGAFMILLSRLMMRTRLLTRQKYLRPVVIAAIWAIYEWTQTFGWWGVPWARLPVGQTTFLVGLQTASLLGPYFITFALVLVNAAFAMAIAERGSIRTVRVMATVACAVLVFQYGVGALMYLREIDGEETVRVAVVQGNIDSNEKWDFSYTQKTLETYEKYTLEAAEQGAEIVVWPESALPYTVTAENGYGEFCSELARNAGVTILVGAFYPSEQAGDYNALICVLPNGEFHETVYAKRRLVPFGEFVPLRPLFSALIPPLAELVMLDEDIVAGADENIISIPEAEIGGLVCFDSIYEGLTRDSVRSGAEILCLGTNDAWFSKSAARYIHNSQAQLRAVESGRYIARAANTGVSMIISSKGDIICELDPLTEGVLVEDIPRNDCVTLYSVIGNAVVYLFIAFLCVILAYELKWRIARRREKQD